MSWIGLALAVVVVTGVGLYLLLGVMIFVTHLVEKRPLRYLAPAPDDDPEWVRLPTRTADRASAEIISNPYQAPGESGFAETNLATAAGLGFVCSGLFAHAKGGTYRTHTVLCVSPSRQTLAVVTWGTIASINADKVILYSALDDGRFLVTSAKPTGADTPGLYENVVVMGADLDRLVRRHEARLRDCGRGVVPFRAENALADYNAIRDRRFRFLIEKGEARFVEPDRAAIRSTLKGAFKAYLGTLRPPKNIERDATPPLAGKPVPTPAPLLWFERLAYMAILGGFILNSRGKATNSSQLLFRLSLFGGGLVALTVVLVTKAVLKWRSR